MDSNQSIFTAESQLGLQECSVKINTRKDWQQTCDIIPRVMNHDMTVVLNSQAQVCLKTLKSEKLKKLHCQVRVYEKRQQSEHCWTQLNTEAWMLSRQALFTAQSFFALVSFASFCQDIYHSSRLTITQQHRPARAIQWPPKSGASTELLGNLW